MNGKTRYESKKQKLYSIGDSPKDRDYDQLLSVEDSALFGKISEYMKGITDIEDVMGDPAYKVANDVVNEMISGYGQDIGRKLNNEKFIRGSFTEETPEDALINEISQIKHEINSSNLNDITSKWIKEWHEKRQRESSLDAKTEEIREFVTSSLDRKGQLSEIIPEVSKKSRMGRSLIIRYVSLTAAVITGSVFLIRSLLPSDDQEKIFSKYYEPYSPVSAVTRSSDAGENESFARALVSYKSADYQAAAAGFSKAVLEESTSLSARFFLGITQLETGNYERAIEILDRVANRQGEYAKEAIWYLGLAYIKTGNKAKAYRYFEILASSPGYYSDRSEKILRRLK